MFRRPGLLAALCAALFALAPAPARADLCLAAETLAHIHDAYKALDRETGTTRNDAAIALLALYLPSTDSDALAATLSETGIPVSEDRLKEVFRDAAAQARSAIGGGSDRDAKRHDINRYWLSGMIFATGCPARWEAEAYRRVSQDLGAGRAPLPGGIFASPYAKAAGIGGAALIGTLGFVALRRSAFWRRQDLRRLPRKPVSLPALIRHGRAEHAVRILDLSLGGAKVDWKGAAPPGQSVIVAVGDHDIPASIVWRNDFFAGLLFDSHLDQAVMDDLLRVQGSMSGR